MASGSRGGPVKDVSSGGSNFRATTAAANTSESTSKAFAQYPVDARLLAFFEQSDESFDYTRSVHALPPPSPPEDQITAYLTKIQRGGHIQSFGCLVAVTDPELRVIAFSANAPDKLKLPFIVGSDVRSLFDPSSARLLEKSASAREITLLNPLWIHSRSSSSRPFYAILHRIDVGIVIDLEPASTDDPTLSIAGAVQSQKLAVRAISRLQSIPSGDLALLCDSVVGHVRELTGYDRVMVYKFHDDEHGEVVAESRRPDLEPYVGLHYPAIDIPQASRFLFRQNRVRMIVDCLSPPVRVVQDESLAQPLCLVGSTLRAPHGCHARYMANMGSISSLAMAIVINTCDSSTTKLWGLVVCHHASPRCTPFPLRHACEFLIQAFAIQLNTELKLALQMTEKRVLRTQTLLCDMLLRDSPKGLVKQSPNVMDLVKCDGAALYYRGMYWPLGVAPTESQIEDIVEWLFARHGDSTGLSTDSLADAGYPKADLLGDAVCGMAVARITRRDFLFWFRSHTAKEIKWGGEKHHPEDRDDGRRMHPRTSFKAFLEVVKNRSLPWENTELDAIHSLQLILRDTFDGKIHLLEDLEMHEFDEFGSVAREMARVIETANVPIFAVNADGMINGWNAKVAEVTGLSVVDAMGKSLARDVVLKESAEVVDKLLYNALRGKEDKNVEIKLRTFGLQKQTKAVVVMVNACSSKDYTNNIVGVCFVGQDVTGQRVVMDKFIHIQGDYKAIMHGPNPLIPPIFASDENTYCSEWNTAMEKLTGWSRGEMTGKLLVGEIFGSSCHLKGPDALTKLTIILLNAIGGQETDKCPFEFFDKNGKYVQALLTANTRINNGRVIGVFCFLQIASPELMMEEMLPENERNASQGKKCSPRMKEIAYICQEIKNPLSGIRFANSLLEMTELTENQKQFLDTSVSCERQILKIIQDVDLERIEDGLLVFDRSEFLLGSVINAVVSQVMILLRERGLQLIPDIPEDIKALSIYGDRFRIQQILVDFLLTMVRCSPSPEGWIEIQARTNLKQNSDGEHLVDLQFKMVCPGEGLPPELVQDMFLSSEWATEEGMGLSMCRRILVLMNGEVQYIRESERCYILIMIELPTSAGGSKSVD
ncbi:Phytochrome B [Acorus calamus]|uniref:Phytochrome B n=1 Tax=Acorus calamus TaxID=4465 RepID=A0AAV9CT67_ACOCL|nr:Phytochrome B [Acorus calamus]